MPKTNAYKLAAEQNRNRSVTVQHPQTSPSPFEQLVLTNNLVPARTAISRRIIVLDCITNRFHGIAGTTVGPMASMGRTGSAMVVAAATGLRRPLLLMLGLRSEFMCRPVQFNSD